MPVKPRSYFTLPLKGFILTILLGLTSCSFIVWGLLNNMEREYRMISAQIPDLQKDIKMIHALGQIMNQPISNVISSEEHAADDTEMQPFREKSNTKKTIFKYVVIDEKCVVPDPSCKECILNAESAEEFSALLRTNPDTLFVYTIAEDLMHRENCAAGATKFSGCLLNYIYNKFNGNFLCIKKLDYKYTGNTFLSSEGRLILTNLSIGKREFRAIEKGIVSSNSVGFNNSHQR